MSKHSSVTQWTLLKRIASIPSFVACCGFFLDSLADVAFVQDIFRWTFHLILFGF